MSEVNSGKGTVHHTNYHFGTSRPTRSETETIAIALRRPRQEITFGCAALACVGGDPTADAAITCGEPQYDALYNAKPSMKNARIDDDQGALVGRSGRVMADGDDLTSAPSSLVARINPSCTMSPLSRKSTRNA